MTGTWQIRPRGTGWVPDLADGSDLTVESEPILEIEHSVLELHRATSLPRRVDHRHSHPEPVYDQGAINASAANAVAGLLGYLERRCHRRRITPSRLFLYKVARSLLLRQGDVGAFHRTTLQALLRFGVPPEVHWPYTVERVDAEPPAFVYGMAERWGDTYAYRLDEQDTSGDELLERVKRRLAYGLEAIFGLYLFPSAVQAARDGRIPHPDRDEGPVAAHSALAAGYDDDLLIRDRGTGAETRGALLLRNSWGPTWGEDGWGWLPYESVRQGLTADWWCLLNRKWAESGAFTPPKGRKVSRKSRARAGGSSPPTQEDGISEAEA